MNPVIVSSCFFTLSITAGIVVKASAIYMIANTVVTIFDSFLFFGIWRVFLFFGNLEDLKGQFLDPLQTPSPSIEHMFLLCSIYTTNTYLNYRYMR